MRSPHLELPRNGVGLLGAALVTASSILIVALAALGILGEGGSPYLGIAIYLLLPGLFVLGLLLVPLGAWLARRRLDRGQGPRELPVLDLNRPADRSRLVLFTGLTVVNLFVAGVAAYSGVTYMESPRFCGSCHSVMAPEHTAYQRSSHARVPCVDCHIGPGASWFVKSKLSGAWQVVSVTFHLYERPIPVPVRNLRPARETCEQCHWPARFTGDRLKVITHFADDEASTERKTVMVLHVGSGGGEGHGIHRHVHPDVRIRYQSDPAREKIPVIEASLPGGVVRTYLAAGAAPDPAAPWRVMDCIDCHNRPSHVFEPPEQVVDAALAAGRIDRRLPFARREALAVLRGTYPSHEAARQGIPAALRARYATLDPARARDTAGALEATGAALAEAWTRNVWPAMRIGWGTYPTFIGHDQAPGCFRCHDGEHRAADGKVLEQDCELCHGLLAVDEPDPQVLKALGR